MIKGLKSISLVVFICLSACSGSDQKNFTPTTYDLDEAYDYLVDVGFMTDAPKGERGYNPSAIFEESAEDVLGLIMAIFPNKEPALVYYLEVAGANLKNASERDLFIDNWVDKVPWFATDLVTALNYIHRTPDNVIVNNALDNIIKRLDTEETVKLLVQQSFIRENMGPDGTGNGEYTIMEEYIEHWPIKHINQCAQNIRAGNSDSNLTEVAETLERISKEKEDTK